MSQIIQATFDGQVLRPEEPLELAPNTRVLITIEIDEQVSSNRGAFLRKARSLQVEGPPDWSEKLDQYLYDQGDVAE